MRSSVTQFNVPVRKIDEVLPEIVLWRGKSDVDERAPFWPFGSTDQAHVRFTREPVAFAGVARDAGTNHVIPRSCPCAVARHAMAEAEFTATEILAAVLTGVRVALEHAVPANLHFLPAPSIENQKQEHPRHT